MSTSTQSLREIVTSHPSAAKIFRRFDIDLWSQGDKSLGEACAEQQLSVDQVLEKLADAEADEIGASPFDPTKLPLGRLIQHIVRIHHQCVRQELPRLAEMACELAIKRSDHHPELQRIAELLEKLRDDTFAHIQKEEQVLFPFISQMDQESIIAYPAAHTCFRSVAQPVLKMVEQHEAADHLVVELRRLTDGYEPPAWACATHTALLAGLRAFETDLRQHVHLENDVLFPRAIEMEALLNNRT
jgi:regulator of cell morphogenesis and NO signaling